MWNKIKQLFSKKYQSDGYHTFEELYQHRNALFLNLCLFYKRKAWWSYKHSDGEEAFGYPWVIVGINYKPGHQITYHINTKEVGIITWERFAERIRYLERAPSFDNHSSRDVINRLKTEKFKK